MKRLLFQGIATVLLLMTLLVACVPDDTSMSTPPLSEDFPTATPIPTIVLRAAPTRNFTLVTGEETSLAQWKGKGVVLNFWATWCVPCRAEMPLLAQFDQSQEQVEVIGVNYLEDRESVAGFVQNFNIPFPVVVDQRGFIAGELNIKGLPTTVFINTEGQIVGSHVGPVTEEMLEEMLAQMVPAS